MLKAYGYKARPVSSGAAAIRAAESSLPDLILLDINMPQLDGYEVCRRLKTDVKLKDVPVIFISGLNEPLDKVRAFQVGGIDYITKPFEVEEVAARVATHLSLRRQQDELAKTIERLHELEHMRDALMQMIVHDMRSPLLALQLSIDVACDASTRGSADLNDILRTAQQSTLFLVDMVTQILDLSRLEAGAWVVEKQPCDLVKLAGAAIDHCRYLSTNKTVELHSPKTLVYECDGNLIQRIIGNLVSNALKFTPAKGRVNVSVRAFRGIVRITVQDNGPGISKENQERIFDKFVQIENSHRRKGYGLGLAFVKMAAEAHGGKAGVQSTLGEGSAFWVDLPSSVPAS